MTLSRTHGLGAIVTAMITPFDEQGELDVREAARLARWLVSRGNEGLVIAGSTGEGQTLDADERIELWKGVKEALGSDAAMIANAGTNATRESVAAVEAAEKAGADAILAVVPYYNKPTQSGMLAHFGAIAQATRLPVVIYNIPGRTGANMLPETLLELAGRHRNIAGVKESSGDLKQIGMILQARPDRFRPLGRRRPPLSALSRAGRRRRRRRCVASLLARISTDARRLFRRTRRRSGADSRVAFAADRCALCNEQPDSG